MLESFIVAGLQVCSFIKDSVKVANFFGTPILKNICERLLLIVYLSPNEIFCLFIHPELNIDLKMENSEATTRDVLKEKMFLNIL